MLTVQITGTLLIAKTSKFEDDNGKEIEYGKIQILIPDMSGDFYQLQNIKVKSPLFSALPDIAKMEGKEILLHLTQESYNGRVTYCLAKPLDDMQKPLKSAS